MQIPVYKREGETPLETLNRLQKIKPELADERLSYVGRLDPMAEGVLLVLVGDENNRRAKYLNLEKEYTFQVLFGITTDTFDVLGMVESITDNDVRIDSDVVTDVVEKLSGDISLVYPPYSSKTVKGKPLWQWAREGRLSEISLPTRDVTVSDLQLIDHRYIDSKILKREVPERIEKVEGDFRQQEIIASWKEALASAESNTRFPLFDFRMVCSSGTYVRRIARRMGEKAGIGAIAYRIVRTRVGEYTA